MRQKVPAEPSKRRHDDEDDPSLREEEASKRQRLTEDRPPEPSGTGGSGNLQGTGTETSTVPPQIEKAAITSIVGRELVLYVDPDTLPLSIVLLCTDEEAIEIINLDDYISDDDDEPLHEMFYSVTEEEEEEAYIPEFETGAGSSGYEFYSEQPASVSPVVETTSTVSPPPQMVPPTSSSSRPEPALSTSSVGPSTVPRVSVRIKTEDEIAHSDQPFPRYPVFVHRDVPINRPKPINTRRPVKWSREKSRKEWQEETRADLFVPEMMSLDKIKFYGLTKASPAYASEYISFMSSPS